ncbi:TPA: lipopolysaccharide biosynthesis protein [Photobacterium damselae]
MIKINALSNLVGKVWGFLSLFIFVPIYIHYLGKENYGFIGFYTTLLAMLSFADLGFSASVTREFARLDDNYKRANILKTYEYIYFAIFILIVVIIFFSKNIIIINWLNVSDMSSYNLATYTTIIFIMGISVGVQLCSNLYVGALMGAENQVICNVIQIVWGLFRGFGVIFALEYIDNSLIMFFYWQLLSNILYVFILYTVSWKKFKSEKACVRLSVLKETYKYALSMAGMGILTAFLSQIDKVFVSKNYSIEMFGYYTIAFTYSLIPFILISTLVKAIFPSLTKKSEDENKESLYYFYNYYSFIALILIVPLSFFLYQNALGILTIWTRSFEIAIQIFDIARFLILYQMFQALTILPHYLSLGFGNVKINIKYCLLSIIIEVILVYILSKSYGLIGISIGLLITGLIIFFPYMFQIHKKYLDNSLTLGWFYKVFFAITFNIIWCYIYSKISYDNNGAIKELFISFLLLYVPMFIISLSFHPRFIEMINEKKERFL